jgi:hypothetical protein
MHTAAVVLDRAVSYALHAASGNSIEHCYYSLVAVLFKLIYSAAGSAVVGTNLLHAIAAYNRCVIACTWHTQFAVYISWICTDKVCW